VFPFHRQSLHWLVDGAIKDRKKEQKKLLRYAEGIVVENKMTRSKGKNNCKKEEVFAKRQPQKKSLPRNARG